MGSLEKTVKVATCSNRLSAHLSSSSPSVRPPPRPSTTSPSSSSSPTQPTTWRCSEELTSRKPSLPELSRDLAASETVPARRTEKAELMMVVTTPHPPPPMLPHQPPQRAPHHLHQPPRP